MGDVTRYVSLRDRVLTRLANGPATFSQLNAGIAAGYRELDREVQKMRRAGLVQSLPRVKGVRPYAEWTLTTAAPTPSSEPPK